VKLFGEHVHSDSLKAIVALSGVTFFLPAFVLSGVTPVVVKQQLQSLTATGATVGRFSGAGTLGALVGTFGTGFFLTSRVHTHTIVLVVGIVLVCLGVLVHWRLNRQASVTAMAAILLILVGGGIASSRVKAPCKVGSAYFGINVVGNEHDRGLKLDNLMHSAVELHDHSQLDFFYTRAMAAAADTTFPSGPDSRPCEACSRPSRWSRSGTTTSWSGPSARFRLRRSPSDFGRSRSRRRRPARRSTPSSATRRC